MDFSHNVTLEKIENDIDQYQDYITKHKYDMARAYLYHIVQQMTEAFTLGYITEHDKEHYVNRLKPK